jgi:cob(I)alamin adenosyltransferase
MTRPVPGWRLRTPRHTLGRVRIYTKTGDAGETSLAGGARVPKDHLRVAAFGDVDEANAAIGAARAASPADAADGLLAQVQRDLFAIGGALASPQPEALRPAQRTRLAVPAERIEALEHAIDDAERDLTPLKHFVLPAGTPQAAALHLARTVCRRAERSAVRLSHQQPVAPEILIYLNRLSDLLFVLARQANHRAGEADGVW